MITPFCLELMDEGLFFRLGPPAQVGLSEAWVSGLRQGPLQVLVDLAGPIEVWGEGVRVGNVRAVLMQESVLMHLGPLSRLGRERA